MYVKTAGKDEEDRRKDRPLFFFLLLSCTFSLDCLSLLCSFVCWLTDFGLIG